jgi:hypothetical protein
VVAEISSGNPYQDYELMNGDILRKFDGDVEESELVWHRDYESRQVYVQQGNGWKLQMDNELPKELKMNDVVLIPAMTYHRLIKGTSALIVRIKEL